MTTNDIAKVKADILDRIPVEHRAEYEMLQKDIRDLDRQEKAIAARRKGFQARVDQIMLAAANAISTDRDLAVLGHSSTAAYKRFQEAVRAIHPRLFHPTNYVVDDAPKNTAPFLGVEVSLYEYGARDITDETPTEVAAALVEFAARFVGDAMPDFGDHPGTVYATFLFSASNRSRHMQMFFTPDGTRATLFISGYYVNEPNPVSGTLAEALAAAIAQSREWAAEDERADDGFGHDDY